MEATLKVISFFIALFVIANESDKLPVSVLTFALVSPGFGAVPPQRYHQKTTG